MNTDFSQKLYKHVNGDMKYYDESMQAVSNLEKFDYEKYYNWCKDNAQFRDKFDQYEIYNYINVFYIFGTVERFVVRLYGYNAQHFWNKLKGEKFFGKDKE